METLAISSVLQVLRCGYRSAQANDVKLCEVRVVPKAQRYPIGVPIPEVKPVGGCSVAQWRGLVPGIYELFIGIRGGKELGQSLPEWWIDGHEESGVCCPLDLAPCAVSAPRNRITTGHVPTAYEARGDKQEEARDYSGGTYDLPFVHGVIEVLVRQRQEPVAVCADYARLADCGFSIVVLVAVQEEFGLRVCDVVAERGEADVDFVVAVMDKPRRIVGDENVHWREIGQRLFDLGLLKEVIAARLVFPGAAKAAESDVSKSEGGAVHVANRRSEWGAGVVIAFDCENLAAVASVCDLKNGVVGEVTAGDEEVNLGVRNSASYKLVIGDDQQIHRELSVTEASRDERAVSSGCSSCGPFLHLATKDHKGRRETERRMKLI